MTAVEVDKSTASADRANPLAWRHASMRQRSATAAQNRHAAIAMHGRGALREAEQLYRAVLKVDESDFDCLHNLGLLCAQEGRLADAVGLLRAGARQDPRSPEAHNNLANVLAMMQRHDQAAAGFSTAIALRPDFAEAHNNLGNAMAAQGKRDEAVQYYRQALALRPDYGDAHLNLGRILSEQGKFEAAEAHLRQALALRARPAETHCRLGDLQRKLGKVDDAATSYRRALELKATLAEAWLGLGRLYLQTDRHDDALGAFMRAPGLAEAWVGRGRALRRLKRPEEAISAFRQALAKGADIETIRYYLAALGAESAPPATPRQLVSAIFDRYSERYDRHVVETLRYRTPNLLLEAVARSRLAPGLHILDLGCGTGLTGALFRSLAGNLVGVDISASMLARARQRQIYDELACADLIEFLRTQDARFDLVLAADVFVYLGDLAQVFAQVPRVLKPHGLFAFSVEAAETQDYVLQPTLRYAHGASYLRRLAEQRGFLLEALETKVLRREGEDDVTGHLVVLRRE